ncbi:MAG: S8 family serine peptidase [Candidatus Heimdallarchaeota archaeon]|nr:S8 family serine peptidase [Candidatus Heimdallarchaeota archaeon]
MSTLTEKRSAIRLADLEAFYLLRIRTLIYQLSFVFIFCLLLVQTPFSRIIYNDNYSIISKEKKSYLERGSLEDSPITFKRVLPTIYPRGSVHPNEIRNSSLINPFTHSQEGELFYYLNAQLEEYFHLAHCHNFIGDKNFGGTFQSNGYTGKGVTVAVLDQGAAYNHSYFSTGSNSLIKSLSITDGFGNAVPATSITSHATNCVGLVKEIAPEVAIISIGQEETNDPEHSKGVFEWLLKHYDEHKIKIVSRSLAYVSATTTPAGWDRVESIIKYLSGNAPHPNNPDLGYISEEEKILFVFPVGNKPGGGLQYEVRWPASMGNLPNILGVGYNDFDDWRGKKDGKDSIHNSADDVLSHNLRLECMAPGEDLFVCMANGSIVKTTEEMVGTSLATPIVTGALALALEKEGREQTNFIENLVRGRCTTIPCEEFFAINKKSPEVYDGFTTDYQALAKYYGYGIVNIPGMLDKWDADWDGLSDRYEYEYFNGELYSPLNPWNNDTDGDGMNDRWEIHYKSLSKTGFDPLINNTGSGAYETEGDLDADGLTNLQESEIGTNPNSMDTDGDNLSDLEEFHGYFFGNPEDYSWVDNNGEVTTNPLAADTDADGLGDDEECAGQSITVTITSNTTSQTFSHILVKTNPNSKDSDSDGLTDFEEIIGVSFWSFSLGQKIFVKDVQTHPLWQDMDKDSLVDGLEVRGYLQHYSDPRKFDSDADGLADAEEYQEYLYSYPEDYEGYNTPQLPHSLNPLEPDIDLDKLLDGLEIKNYHTSPFEQDTDGDDLSDGEEVNYYSTSPLDLDSDNDSFFDMVEVAEGTDPLDPRSFPVSGGTAMLNVSKVGLSFPLLVCLSLVLTLRKRRK